MEKNTQPKTIEFQQMLKEEKLKAQETLTLKLIQPMNAYNLLQDMRHLVILDFREKDNFDESHIRKSQISTLESYRQDMINAISSKNKVFASHYPEDDLKRFLFIFPESNWKSYESQISKEIKEIGDFILKTFQDRIGKAFYLKEFSKFSQKYKFMCIPEDTSEKRKIVSMQRFPSEIKENFFLGNMINVMDKNLNQLKLLGIKTIVYFTPEKFDYLESEFNCIHYQVTESKQSDIDMEEAAEKIIENMKDKEKGPVFVFCISGQVSAAVAMKVMIETNRAWSKEIAMAYVINKRYEAREIQPWLWQQIHLQSKKKQQLVN